MRLEPIAKGQAQHAPLGAGRASLQHIVHAVKEVRRIPRVEGKRAESVEWLKEARRPFPSIRDQAFDAEFARAAGKGIYRRRIPPLQIEKSMLVLQLICRAMPLRLRGQPLASPL